MTPSIGEQYPHGLRIFVVEDDLMITMMMRSMLDKLGCLVVGTADTVKQALEMVDATNAIDVAILDVNIGDDVVFPVADLLLEREVPCIFSTGYATPVLTERYPLCGLLDKPYVLKGLLKSLLALQEGLPAS
jgi:CheY-like chemotaxis protein